MVSIMNVITHFCGKRQTQSNIGQHVKHSTIAKVLRLDKETFSRFAMCGKCTTLNYPAPDPKSITDQDNKCGYMAYHSSNCQPRDTKLYDKFISAKAAAAANSSSSSSNPVVFSWRPKYTYCVANIESRLREMFVQPNFRQNLNHWRALRPKLLASNLHYDIYTSELWEKWQTVETDDYNEEPFLQVHPGGEAIAFLLNIDWWQPFKRTAFSSGAMYLTILNLPPSLRHLKSNVIVLGIIPGGKEKDINMKSILQPVMDQITRLFKDGCKITKILVKAMIILVSCDQPATRKTVGYGGAGGYIGCTFCKIVYRYIKTNRKNKNGEPISVMCCPDDFGIGESRSVEEFLDSVYKYRDAKTAAARKRCRQNIGVTDTPLEPIITLGYDPLQGVGIDVLHAWWLGISKNIFKAAKGYGILTASVLLDLQRRMDRLEVPRDVGRIVTSLGTGSQFKGIEYKNMFVIFFPSLFFPFHSHIARLVALELSGDDCDEVSSQDGTDQEDNESIELDMEDTDDDEEEAYEMNDHDITDYHVVHEGKQINIVVLFFRIIVKLQTTVMPLLHPIIKKPTLEAGHETIYALMKMVRSFLTSLKLATNAHLVCHVPDNIKFCGTTSATKLFGLESMNGALGRMNRNQHIEASLMKRVTQSDRLHSVIATDAYMKDETLLVNEIFSKTATNPRAAAKTGDRLAQVDPNWIDTTVGKMMLGRWMNDISAGESTSFITCLFDIYINVVNNIVS